MIYRIILLVSLSALVCSCKKEGALPEYNVDPVVTAYLYPGKALTLQLQHQRSTSSQTFSSPALDSLDITITAGDTLYHLTPAGNGNYTDTTLIVKAGVNYKLNFKYNEKFVTAATIVPSKPDSFTLSASEISFAQITSSTTKFPPIGQAEPVTLSWKNSDASYYLTVVENIANTLVRTDLTVDSTDTTLVFRNRPVQTSGDELNTRSFKYFGKHRIVLFHINPDYASLYNKSNNNSQNLSTPSTGITNGVGIFTGVNSDTLFLQVTKE